MVTFQISKKKKKKKNTLISHSNQLQSLGTYEAFKVASLNPLNFHVKEI